MKRPMEDGEGKGEKTEENGGKWRKRRKGRISRMNGAMEENSGNGERGGKGRSKTVVWSALPKATYHS